MVGNSTEEYLLAVELEAFFLGELYGADAEKVLNTVDSLALLLQDDFGTVEVGRLARPKLRMCHSKERHFYLIDSQLDVLGHFARALSHEGAIGSIDFTLERHIEPLSACSLNLDLQLYRSLTFRDGGRGDVETVACD